MQRLSNTKMRRLLFACIAALSLCGCGPSRSVTTEQTYLPTPSPPKYLYPFRKTPEEGVDEKSYLAVEKYVNKMPVQKPDKYCQTSVSSLDVLTSGPVEGNLRFNTKYNTAWNNSDEDDFGFNETNNDNAELGAVQTGNLYLYYKYEVKISYIGDLNNAFYGQMINKNPIPLDSNDSEVFFRAETPQNDHIGQVWRISKDADAKEFKKKYTVFEQDGQNIRWIGCTGGGAGMMGVGFENKKQFLIVYAGSCGRITNLKIYKITYPAGQKPMMTEIKSLKGEVKSFQFWPEK